jgi:tyrosine-protein kinase Etk/Wzc
MDIETKLSAPEKHADTLRDTPFQGGEDRKDDNISLLDLLIVLAERKRTIAWFTLTSLVLAVIVSLLLPKRYTATVTLLPPQQNSTLSGALASQLGNLGGVAALAGGSLGIRNPNDMYVAMFKSETVENAMVKHFGLMERYHERYLSAARKHFESNTTVSGDGKDGLIHISVEDRDPRRAAELANGYMDQFRELSQHLAITEAAQRALFFRQQLEQAKDNLANAEQSLAETEQETGLIQVDSQARALIESAAALSGQIAAKEVQIQAMQTYATGQNAQLIQAQQELDGLRAQLAKLGGSQDLSSGGILVPKGQVPKASLEYIRKLREVKSDETIFEVLARQFELAKLDEAKEGALIQVVDPAIPPDRRSSPKRTLIVIGATFVGFLAGILCALGQSALERLKEDPETSSKLAFLWRALFFRRQENLPGRQARN